MLHLPSALLHLPSVKCSATTAECQVRCYTHRVSSATDTCRVSSALYTAECQVPPTPAECQLHATQALVVAWQPYWISHGLAPCLMEKRAALHWADLWGC
eukprot:1042459-Amphidinium_carterae.1